LNQPNETACVNWNQYYTNCTQLGNNPFQGTISFDNIGLAWVAIFLVSFEATKQQIAFVIGRR
jgi:voltage-dependent calcium channel T type alpha-1G